MLIMSLCDNADVLSVVKVVKTVVTILKVAVPIILIISLMINYLNAVKDNDAEALAKANKQLVSKTIAAVLIFLIPSFVEVIAEISSFDTDNYISCFENANDEYITSLIESNARIYLDFAKDSLRRPDYILAENMINKVENDGVREELLTELEQVKKDIEEKEKKEKEEKKSHDQDVNFDSLGFSTTLFTPGVSGSVDNVMGVYLYLQCDSRWKDIVYDYTPQNGSRTICHSACGYTSFAMIAAGFNNDTSINPYTVIKDMRKLNDGEKTSRGWGAAPWSELSDNANIAKYHLSSKPVSKSSIESELKMGHPIILEVPGHYIVLSYSSRGKIVVLDPAQWKDTRKGSGERNSISEIEAAYGSIVKAYAYTRI